MITVDTLLGRVLDTVAVLDPLEMQLLDAHGCILATDVTAPAALPRFDSAALDGYAVRAADVRTATPEGAVELPVSGDISGVGSSVLSVQPGLCARVVRGARMPPGADSVVPAEWTDGGVARVRIAHAPPLGGFVVRAASEVRAGQPLLRAGSLLGAAQLGLLAAVGRRSVAVHPRPRVVVISAASDDADATDAAAADDATSHALTGAAIEAGAVGYHVGTVAADVRRFSDTIEDHLIQADVVLASVGSGRGFDVVRQVLAAIGTVTFDQVAMEPGTTQGFGVIGPEQTPIFVVPGDVSGALVSFEVLVRPALRRMLGGVSVNRPQVSAAISQSIATRPGMRHYLPVRVTRDATGWNALPAALPGAPMLVGLATANGLAVVPEQQSDVAPGSPVTTWLLERRGQ